ncbi:Gcv operon activator [Marinibacterium anthonyi]|nr:Gcv operon activator [Marinibacterium anthonyi]
MSNRPTNNSPTNNRMSKLPHVTWLRAFEAAARHSSFSSAAEELGLTPAAVSQHIRLLEQHLGVNLFKRLPRGVMLSDMGQAYALPIRKAFADMEDATSGLFTVRRKRRLHVRTSISYGPLVLGPKLAAFSAMYPDIELQMTTAVWSDRLDDPRIDIDIRYGTGGWDDPHIWPLSHETGIVLCNPDHARSFGPEPDLGAMVQAGVVLILGSEMEWERLAEHFSLDLPMPGRVARADSSMLALQMMVGGPGAAIIHESFARDYLAQGLLVSPFPYRLPIREAYYMIVRDDALARPEVRAFRDWIVSWQAAEDIPDATA